MSASWDMVPMVPITSSSPPMVVVYQPAISPMGMEKSLTLVRTPASSPRRERCASRRRTKSAP